MYHHCIGIGYCAGLVHFSFERRIWGSRADETCCAASVSPEDKFSENPCKAHRQNERNPGPLAVDKRFKCLKRINIPNTYEKHFEKNTLEDKFPIMAVEHGCIVSKEADVTVAFRVELPELFSVTTKEYEAIHAT